MKSFKTFKQPLQEAKNTHMTHIEDLVLDGGVKGARQAILALRSLRDMLAGNTPTAADITVKWDGAPAVFAGIDPSDGEFFVAKKGIFAKNAKVYKSHGDIDADTKGDLSKKLKLAYDHLKNLGIEGVIQGDFMFDKADLGSEKIDGTKYTTFHPNTIMYAIPKGTPLEKQISKAKIGIVWHTRYKGSSFETMSAEFGVEIVSKLKKTSKVWQVDASLPQQEGAVLDAADTKAVTLALSNAGKIFKKIASKTLKEIEEDSELNLLINTFNNTKVRAAERITDPKKHVSDLISWVNQRYYKQKEKLKSDKGKAGIDAKKDRIMAFFNKKNQKNLENVFKLQNFIVDAKLIIINKLNSLSNVGTFLKTKSGFKVTNPEGFVAIDRMEGGAVKLVDRLEFSTNNFSADIIKGWDNPG
jgi:hypothetical protein